MVEIMAVAKAFIWLESQNYTRVCVLSDSVSMVPKVRLILHTQRLDSLQRAKICIITIFAPGHVGIWADERAGLATTDDGQIMDHSGVVNALREFGRVEDLESGDLTLLPRMYELEGRMASLGLSGFHGT